MTDSSRLLVIANKTCPCPGLPEEIERRVDGRTADVLVVAPALNSRLGHLTNAVEHVISRFGFEEEQPQPSV